MSAPEFTRINDPKASYRNPHINFIVVLTGFKDSDQASTRMYQLAAQVKPLMKDFGLRINSFEEAAFNTEFAGINWNAGECVQVVLRGPTGKFLPLSHVLAVFHHELAHCQFMNHIPSQHGALTTALKKACKKLQEKGYFGDGFWSEGRSINDKISRGDGLGSISSFRPLELCGGAVRGNAPGGRKKPTKFNGYRKPRPTRKRAPQLVGEGRNFKGPSIHSGAQTPANFKGSKSRMTKSLPGQGFRLDGNDHFRGATKANGIHKNDPNSTFGKSAKGKSAAAMRADALELAIKKQKRSLESENGDGEFEDFMDERNDLEVEDLDELQSDEESDEELNEEDEKDRKKRLKDAVDLRDSDSDSEKDELHSDSDLEPFNFKSNDSSNGKGKGKKRGIGKGKETSKSKKSSSNPNNSQSNRLSNKEISEKTRKVEGREIGETWNEMDEDFNVDLLGSEESEEEKNQTSRNVRRNTINRGNAKRGVDSDLDREEGERYYSLHGHYPHGSDDEENVGDSFLVELAMRREEREEEREKKKRNNSKSQFIGSNKRLPGSSSASSSTTKLKRKRLSTTEVSLLESENQITTMNSKTSNQSKGVSQNSISNSRPQNQPKKVKPSAEKPEIVDLTISSDDDDDDDESPAPDSGINLPVSRPRFNSSIEEKKWEEMELLKAEKRKREEREKKKSKNSSQVNGTSSFASTSISTSGSGFGSDIASGSGSRSFPNTKGTGNSTTSSDKPPMNLQWECLTCTLRNEWNAHRCEVCNTSRGSSILGA